MPAAAAVTCREERVLHCTFFYLLSIIMTCLCLFLCSSCGCGELRSSRVVSSHGLLLRRIHIEAGWNLLKSGFGL